MSGLAMRAAILSLACAVGAMASAPATAQQQTGQISKTALSGEWIRVDAFYHINPDCSHVGYPTIRVTSGPSAGRVSIKREKGFPSFESGTTRAKCNTQRVANVVVYYRSNRRFSGADQFSLEFFWTDGDYWTRTVSIDVR